MNLINKCLECGKKPTAMSHNGKWFTACANKKCKAFMKSYMADNAYDSVQQWNTANKPNE